MTPSPRSIVAGEREAGTRCVHCQQQINLGDATCVCQDCGGVHHEACWRSSQGCAAYECSPASQATIGDAQSLLKVTSDQLAVAQPLTPRKSFADDSALDNREAKPKPWSRTSVGALILAVLGIPLFGLITGLVAIVVGCIALAGYTSHRRGFSLAVAGVLLGLFDVIGWGVGLALYFETPHGAISLEQLTLDPESLQQLPERIGRAMRANVLIESRAGLLHHGLGAGVILRIRDNSALIVTNRHVVDHDYSDGTRQEPTNLAELGTFLVTTVDQSTTPAHVEWVAPLGVDLAILSMPLLSREPQEAHWNSTATPHVSDEVFAVGNPHGLGWTHTAGDISRIARDSRGSFNFRVLQTTAAINPGNSGGGLYDARGRLIGVNTLTGDKRFAEGLGFAISLAALLELAPERFKLAPRNPEAATE